MKGSKRECSDAEGGQPLQRRRRVQFAPEPQIGDAAAAAEEAPSEEAYSREDSPSFASRDQSPSVPSHARLHRAGEGPDGGLVDVDSLESKFTKETVEDLRRRKRALAAGVERLGLGARAADFDVNDSAAAADAAGEADPDEADAGEVPLEPFNMRKEMQEGAFDEDGTYLWRKTNPDEVRDPWLDSLADSSSSVSDAVRQRLFAASESSPVPEVSVDVVDSLRKILQVLHPTETPSRALRRLAEGGPSRGPHAAAGGAPSKGKGKKSRLLPALAAAAERDAAAAAAAAATATEAGGGLDSGEKQKAFDSLTEICTALLATGRNVYFLSKQQLEEMLQKEVSASRDSSSNDASAAHEAEAVLWQFRWTQNMHDKDVHGPYDSSTFLSWIQQGFISDSNPTEVRRVTPANEPLDGVWLPWRSVDFRSEEQMQKQADLQEEAEAEWEAEEDARLAREARGKQTEEDDDDRD
ncbi:hypothetical protein Efla_005247 [Eimeria flavescens]